VIRIALDAMGGDSAPGVEVEGALRALRDLPPVFLIQLVGPTDVVEAELARHPAVDRSRIEVHEAPDVIGMGEKPLTAVRRKPKSSLAVGLQMQAEGRSDAFVSAGNTGALLAGSTMLLGLHDGVDRASVGALLPTADHPVLLLDAGANVDCSARELVNFAYLGSAYMRDVLRRENPGVGLLNVGEEDEKGGSVVKEAHRLLRAAPRIRYLGNIEGRDILPGHPKHGPIDVVICDGHVGNAVLKFYESVIHMINRLLGRVPGLLQREDVRQSLGMLDYSQYGGAPLLGIRGISIVCHGSSPVNAIKHAIRVAVQSVESDLDAHIQAEFSLHHAQESSG